MNIQQIATLAHKKKKCNKVKAFEIIKRGEFNQQDHVDLYSHFFPSITKPKTLEQWVAKVAPKKDVRIYLNNVVKSDGERIFATDGHRAHMYHTNDYPEGYYDLALNQINIPIEKYPDIDSCFELINHITVDITDAELRETLFGHAYIFNNSEYGFNQEYVDLALVLGYESIHLGADQYGNLLLRIDCENSTAIIASMIL